MIRVGDGEPERSRKSKAYVAMVCRNYTFMTGQTFQLQPYPISAPFPTSVLGPYDVHIVALDLDRLARKVKVSARVFWHYNGHTFCDEVVGWFSTP